LTREQYIEAMSQAQQNQPNRGPGGPGGGGGGFKMPDPAETFNKLANGKDFIVIAEQNQWFRPRLEEWASKNGITDGKLTKEQFTALSEECRQQMQAGGGPQRGPGGPGGGPGGDRYRGPGGDRDRMTDEQREAYERERALQKFNDRDRNHDGVLDNDE